MSTITKEKAAEVPVKTEGPAPVWNPWPDMEALQNEWLATLSNFWSRPWPMPLAQMRAAAAQHFQPALNIYTDKGNLVLEAALPGVEKKDIHIHATRDSISLSGEYRKETREDKDKYYHSEIRQGSFQRKVALPAEVQSEKVSATLNDGILRVTMPLVDSAALLGVQVPVS